jgi:hypothetical protein
MARKSAKVSSGLFSDVFKVKRKRADDWFDPVLILDTKLFVDPFLVFQEADPDWKKAHRELVLYFDACFTLIAQSGGNPKSLQYTKALSLLRFPEPKEFCLGYVMEGTSGAGGGKGYAAAIAQAIVDAIGRGARHPAHFEELGIFNEGIGPDRISDIACNVLRPRFIRYTQQVARRHRIKMARFEIGGAEFDKVRQRWRKKNVLLPKNPFTGGPILLVPQRFLRDLPILNANDWWDSSEAEQLRNDLNIEVMGKVSKDEIIELARKHPEAVAAWVQSREAAPPSPYDLKADRKGVYGWAPAASEYVSAHPLKLKGPKEISEFMDAISAVINQYTLFIEERGGWRLLWNDDKSEKPEEAAQLVFLGLARGYCEANGIVLDREVNLGRGPVDFKFSNGYEARALLEMKKLHNGKFWNGLLRQLPSYLKSEGCEVGWFVAIRYRKARSAAVRVRYLGSLGPAELGNGVRVIVADARPKASASKLAS